MRSDKKGKIRGEKKPTFSDISRVYLWAKSFIPTRFSGRWKRELRYAGFDIDPGEFAGFMLINGFLIAVLVSLVTIALRSSPLITLAAFIACFFIFQIFLDLVLRLLSDSRARLCESVFPDVLILMSSNIRAGITPDHALALSIREEFGPLAEELKVASQRAMAGTDLGDVLLESTEGIKSNLIKGSLQLIVEGIRGGGEISSLMEETARDIRNMELLRSEIRAQVRTYSLFILFATILGSPALFAVSVHLANSLSMISPMNVELPAETLGNMPFMSMKPVRYEPLFLRNYCLISITLVSISASLLIGLIEHGDELRGVRFIPVLLPIAWGIFFFVTNVVAGFSGAITGMV